MKIFTKRILLFTLSLVAILSLCALSGCEEGDFSDILSGSQDDNGSLSDGENQGANEHEHNFAEIVLPQYLKAGVTCETPAVYYKSCAICGEKSELTFEYGTPEHLYGEWVCNGSGTHTKTCARVTTHTLTEDCSGGVATCTSKAVCSECGGEYGDLLEHTYAQTYVYDETHHWQAATCGCDLKQDYAEHTFDDEGWCTVCNKSPFTEGVLYDLSTDGTYAEVIGYEGTSKKVRIVDTYNDLPVKTIYSSAFKDNETITQVIIPDSVTSIGERAFWWCSGLTSITIGNGVTSIGEAAFSCCSRLISVTIPDSVTSIVSSAFYGCSRLTSMAIPDSVTSIGHSAFSGCSGLTSIIIPDSVTSIGSSAFSGCSKLQFNEYDNAKYLGNDENPYHALISIKNTNYSSCSVHNDTKVISGDAFNNCGRLTSITIPDGVTSIGEDAFYECSSLKSITIPASLVSISGFQTFFACRALENIYISDMSAWCNISGISTLMLYTSSNKKIYLNNEIITDLVIPDGVTSIRGYAFEKCSELTSVTIPNSVTSIGGCAFSGCSGLNEIKFSGTVAEWNAITKVSSWNNGVPATKVVCKDGEVKL